MTSEQVVENRFEVLRMIEQVQIMYIFFFFWFVLVLIIRDHFRVCYGKTKSKTNNNAGKVIMSLLARKDSVTVL